MNLFNSLGSNYSWPQAIGQLFAIGGKKSQATAIQLLGEHYGGQVTLTYKGREALELALRRSGLAKDSSVAINGFTCYVLYRAVERAGYEPVMVDIERNTMHFGIENLQRAVAELPTIKAVIVQNTLGYPVDMVKIEAFCKKNGLLLIEDLAHSLGSVYADGREAGTVGDFTMLSFSQDKPLDVVAGGALVDRRPSALANTQKLANIGLWQQLKNRAYGLWTSIIRALYPIKLGRYLHFVLKKARWLATPMSDGLEGIHKLPLASAKLVAKRWTSRQAALQRRRSIAAIYSAELPDELHLKAPNGQAGFLRFPILVNDPSKVVAELRKHHVYISDTWYDAPLAPKKYLAKTNYQAGTCPEAERLCRHIVNLPTHQKVKPVDARAICAIIRKMVNTNVAS